MRVIYLQLNGFADLHLHTTASDGVLQPAEVVALAKRKGLDTIAITDHDTVKGLENALEAGTELSINVIPGIELSTLAGEREIHILGYFIDYHNMVLLEKLDLLIKARENRAVKMVEKLQLMGLEIDLKQVRDIAGGEYFGRPHIARAMVEKGYISKESEAFSEEYIGRGGLAYVERFELYPQEAITLIREARGIPVLAHPGYLSKGKPMEEEEIALLVQVGLRGIEVFYGRHSCEQVVYYNRMAENSALLVTGGSDDHGDPKAINHIGSIQLSKVYVEALIDEKSKQY